MKKALVFSGGGARGAYQLGVWKALRELNKTFDIVTGTSIGSLNGALYVQGDYEKAEELWYNVKPSDVIDTDIENPKRAEMSIILHAFLGGHKTHPLENLLIEHIDEKKVRESSVDFGIVTVSFPRLEPNFLQIKMIENGTLHENLVASSSVFPAFRPKKIKDKYYIDGGFHDNLPINLAAEMGAKEIFAIDLGSIGLKQKSKYEDIKVTTLKPSRPLGSILLFDKETVKENARLGYLDTLAHFNKIRGNLVHFPLNEYQEYRRSVIEAFFARINEVLGSEEERTFFDLFRVVGNLFLFKKSRLDGNFDREKVVLYAVDEIARIAEIDNLSVHRVKDFIQNTKEALENNENTAEDMRQLRRAILLIKKAIRSGDVNRGFYLTSLRHPAILLAAFLIVVIEETQLKQEEEK